MIQRAQDGPRRDRRPPPDLGPVLALVGAGAALRVAGARLGGMALLPDPRIETAARHLAAGHGLALGPSTAPAPTAAVPPIAPTLASVALRMVHGHPLAIPALAVLLGALCAPAAARLASGLHGPTAGRAAGWAVALSPFLIAGAAPLEAPAFALLLLLALAASAEWLRTPRRLRAVLAGVLWGLCGLAGSAGLLLPPLVLAWGWRPLGLTLPPRERVNQTLLLALGWLGVVAPWTLRDCLALRAPVGVTTAMGPALLSGANADVWNDPARRGGAIDVLAVEPYASQLRGLPEPARDTAARGMALRFVAARQAELVPVLGARLARLWAARPLADDPRDDASRPPGAVARLLSVLEILWLLLAAWGALRTLQGPRRWFQSLPLAALALLTVAAIAVSGSARARLGFEPLVALLAGVGALNARRSLHLRRRGLRIVPRSAGAEHPI